MIDQITTSQMKKLQQQYLSGMQPNQAVMQGKNYIEPQGND